MLKTVQVLLCVSRCAGEEACCVGRGYLDSRDADASKQEGRHSSQHALRDGSEESPNLEMQQQQS